MSLSGLEELDLSWSLRNSLTITGNVVVEGDLSTTGFIYDGGLPITIDGDDNVWSANNLFKNVQPTFLAPLADEDMATSDYMETEFSDLGVSLLPTNNTWLGRNVMNVLPTITGVATAGTDEMINLTGLNTLFATSTGELGLDNKWTGENTFTNKVNVTTPANDAQFGNKKYVDDEIAAYNAAGGVIEYVESLIQTGSLNITLDPDVYTHMYVCMVSGGGAGSPAGAVASGSSVITYGGSGSYAAFKVPAYNGTATYSFISPDVAVFTNYAGQQLVLVEAGGFPADQNSNGVGGEIQELSGIIGVQQINGSVGIRQTPIVDSSIIRSYNIGCLNGYGQGGSFNYLTGASTSPTGFYALFIKFRV
jgi:hypothetical protein